MFDSRSNKLWSCTSILHCRHTVRSVWNCWTKNYKLESVLPCHLVRKRAAEQPSFKFARYQMSLQPWTRQLQRKHAESRLAGFFPCGAVWLGPGVVGPMWCCVVMPTWYCVVQLMMCCVVRPMRAYCASVAVYGGILPVRSPVVSGSGADRFWCRPRPGPNPFQSGDPFHRGVEQRVLSVTGHEVCWPKKM